MRQRRFISYYAENEAAIMRLPAGERRACGRRLDEQAMAALVLLTIATFLITAWIHPLLCLIATPSVAVSGFVWIMRRYARYRRA